MERGQRCTKPVLIDKDSKEHGSCLRPEGHSHWCALDTEEAGILRVSTVLSWAKLKLVTYLGDPITRRYAIEYAKDMLDDALHTLEQVREWQKSEASVAADALSAGRHEDAIRAIVDVIGKDEFARIALEVASDRLCHYEITKNGTTSIKPPLGGWPQPQGQIQFSIETTGGRDR